MIKCLNLLELFKCWSENTQLVSGAREFVTFRNDADPRSLLIDNVHLAKDTRSIYEGHYYPNPSYLKNSQSYSSNRNAVSLIRNQSYIARDRDSSNTHHFNRGSGTLDENRPGSRGSTSRHFRDSSPLKRKQFYDSSSSTHRCHTAEFPDFNSQ